MSELHSIMTQDEPDCKANAPVAETSETSGSTLSKGQKKKLKAKAKKALEQDPVQSNQISTDGVPVDKQTNDNSESDDGGDDQIVESEQADAGADKKKKKKKKKKNQSNNDWSKASMLLHLHTGPPRFNAAGIKPVKQQTSPPTVPVFDQYPNHVYPEGQILPHAGDFNTYRVTSEEKRKIDQVNNPEILRDLRESAEVHRQVRGDFMKWVKPGRSMIEIVQYIESGTRALIQGSNQSTNRINRGWAFPTGVSLNHVAAHYTPNSNDRTILQQGDVMKVDFGVHVNGHIIDSAFTVAFDSKFDDLLEAVRASTEAGLAAAGVDVRMTEIGEIIQEVMESHEVTLNGKTYRVKPLRNLCGHSIRPYQIHGGKSVPVVKNGDQTKMEEDELYAIETFGSVAGRGLTVEDGECSHYMKEYSHDIQPAVSRLKSKAAKDLLKHIDTNHSTLAFCRRWLDDAGEKNYLMALKQLCEANIVQPCPPLYENRGAYTAQFEHTFMLRPNCNEIFSRGQEY